MQGCMFTAVSSGVNTPKRAVNAFVVGPWPATVPTQDGCGCPTAEDSCNDRVYFALPGGSYRMRASGWGHFWIRLPVKV
jgi:hypothetical protein